MCAIILEVPKPRLGEMEGVCSQLEEQLLLWLEYYPQVASYERSDIGTPFARTRALKNCPQAIHQATA